MYGKQFCETSQTSPSSVPDLRISCVSQASTGKSKAKRPLVFCLLRWWAESGTLEVSGKAGLGGTAEDVEV